jgi:hypothetical protein
MKTPGYILLFRCVNCGRPEASATYSSASFLPHYQIEARIYEANCAACGWKGEVCGISAVQIHYSPGAKAQET